jgi:hypothetical protein
MAKEVPVKTYRITVRDGSNVIAKTYAESPDLMTLLDSYKIVQHARGLYGEHVIVDVTLVDTRHAYLQTCIATSRARFKG